MEDTIDSILQNMAEVAAPLPPVNDSVPRSMFDIPNLNEVRGVAESSGRFVDQRCDSVMSVVSAPSPTFPRLEDTFMEEPAFVPPVAKPPSVRRMERRRSIDNSLLSRNHTNSPVMTSTRRVSRSTPKQPDQPRPPKPDNTRKQPEIVRSSSGDSATRRSGVTSRDVRNSKLTGGQIGGAPKITRSGRECKERKTSLPNINKNNHIVRDFSYVHT